MNQKEDFEFKDEESKKMWELYCKINVDDAYGTTVISYIKRWALLMQNEINSGKKIADIAKDTSRRADIEGITGYMYGCAVAVLAQYWKYGEELRNWHNQEYGYEGDGVANPIKLEFL